MAEIVYKQPPYAVEKRGNVFIVLTPGGAENPEKFTSLDAAKKAIQQFVNPFMNADHLVELKKGQRIKDNHGKEYVVREQQERMVYVEGSQTPLHITKVHVVNAFQNGRDKAEAYLNSRMEATGVRVENAETKYISKVDIRIPSGKILPRGTVFYKKGAGLVPWFDRSMEPLNIKESDVLKETFENIRSIEGPKNYQAATDVAIKKAQDTIAFYIKDGWEKQKAIDKVKGESTLGPASWAKVIDGIK